jgi:hypothetical protein
MPYFAATKGRNEMDDRQNLWAFRRASRGNTLGALLSVVVALVLAYGAPVCSQVVGWGDDSQGAAEQHPTLAATREAALGAGVRVVEVLYFDVDNDGLDDELVTVRAVPTDGSDDRPTDNFCEDVPNQATDCNHSLVFLKRSQAGWTPFAVYGGFTQTT